MQTNTAARPSLGSPGLMFLPGLLYACVVRLRNCFYDRRFFAQGRLPYPVISIGNLTLGGSGKTPLAIHMAQVIARMGRIPVLLSRGYGRLRKNPLIVKPGERIAFPAQALGDEPALIRQHAPETWLGISSDRYAVGLQIGRWTQNPVFLLDDGFQHRRLHRDLDLVVIDRTQPLLQNRVVPRGTLREPLAGLRRADILVINGAFRSEQADPLEELVRRFSPNAAIKHCVQRIDRLVEFVHWRAAGAAGAPCADMPTVYLAAAIGNPDRFSKDVREFGIEIKGARFFRAHFPLRGNDWRSCAEAARRCGAGALLTTEKDAIKLTEGIDYPLLVAVQSMRLFEQADLERKLQSVFEGGN